MCCALMPCLARVSSIACTAALPLAVLLLLLLLLLLPLACTTRPRRRVRGSTMAEQRICAPACAEATADAAALLNLVPSGGGGGPWGLEQLPLLAGVGPAAGGWAEFESCPSPGNAPRADNAGRPLEASNECREVRAGAPRGKSAGLARWLNVMGRPTASS